MRITNNMITDRVLSNLNSNLERLATIQEQMSSGKTVSKPSDDPVYVSRIMRLQAVVQEQEKYQKNMEDAQSYVDNAEAALATVSEVLNRARELGIYGANGSLDDSDRKALADEVDELIDEVIQVANSSFDGKYIFAGFETEDPPFSRQADDTITYGGDDGKMLWQIARGVTLAVNIPGDELFQSPGTNVFDALVNLKSTLETGDLPALASSCIQDLDAAVDHVLSERAVLGARSNRLAVAQDRAFTSTINMTELLSKLEDVDLAAASIHFSTAEAVYNAALATGAQVIKPTLLDYLR